MSHQTPRVVNNTLCIEKDQRSYKIALDSVEWFEWLQHATTFSYQQHGPSFTAQRRERKGRWYWYAYAKRNGELNCVYLGRAEALMAERLHEIAHKLNPWLRSINDSDASQDYTRSTIVEQQTRQALIQQLITVNGQGQSLLCFEEAKHVIDALRERLQHNRRLDYSAATQSLVLAEALLEAYARQLAAEAVPANIAMGRQKHAEIDWRAERARSGGEVF